MYVNIHYSQNFKYMLLEIGSCELIKLLRGALYDN
jgi:hypothetical protein